MILVTGATGHVGGRAAELLARRGLPLRLMVRDPRRAPRIEAEVVTGDYADPPSMDRAFAGVDTLFVVSGEAPPHERARLHANAFAAAQRAAVGHVVYLSLQGSGPDSAYPFACDHWESEQALRRTGLPHTILRNGKYAEQIVGMIGDDGVVRGPADDGPVAWISREDSARMVAAVLADPPGGTVEYAGAEALTLVETMAVLSSVVGRRLSYAEESPETVRARSVVRDEPAWRGDLAVGTYLAIARGEYARTSDAFERLVGEPPRPFWRWAVGNPLLDPWMPSLEVTEEAVANTLDDLRWIDDLDDPAIQGHLGFLARQYEETAGTPELIRAFLRLFERFPESPPELDGNQEVLFMLSTLPGVAPLLLQSLAMAPSALGVALVVRLLTNEEVFCGEIDLRMVLVQLAADRATPPRAHREAIDWLGDREIEPWLRIPGEPIPD